MAQTINNRKRRAPIYTGFTALTLFFSQKTLPLFSRNAATSAWPFSAALKNGVEPHCTEIEPDTTDYLDHTLSKKCFNTFHTVYITEQVKE